MKILFTGFEPFGKWNLNPTAIAVKEMDGKIINGYRIIGRVLPLRYKEIQPLLEDLVNDFSPKAIVMSGQAGGDSIRLEKNAQNKAHCPIPYNCGTLVENEILEEQGPDQLQSTLPLEKIYNAINSAGINVKFSESAGTFGCNQVFYHSRHDFPSIPAGFIHVPLLPEQVDENKPSMKQTVITKALFTAIETVANSL